MTVCHLLFQLPLIVYVSCILSDRVFSFVVNKLDLYKIVCANCCPCKYQNPRSLSRILFCNVNIVAHQCIFCFNILMLIDFFTMVAGHFKLKLMLKIDDNFKILIILQSHLILCPTNYHRQKKSKNYFRDLTSIAFTKIIFLKWTACHHLTKEACCCAHDAETNSVEESRTC